MTICIDQHGNPVSCDAPGAMVAPGQSIRADVLTMDSAQRSLPSVHIDTDAVQAAYDERTANAWKRGVTQSVSCDPEDEHDRRVGDAWRRPAADTASSASGCQSVSRSHVADGDDAQARYLNRLTNSWRTA